MSIFAKITKEPIHIGEANLVHNEIGARIIFEGIVRSQEGDRSIEGLEYEAYEAMAQKKLESIAEKLIALYRVESISVVHRVGYVPVGEVSLLLVVQSCHRKEGLACCDAYIDELKKEVPIWKSAVF